MMLKSVSSRVTLCRYSPGLSPVYALLFTLYFVITPFGLLGGAHVTLTPSCAPSIFAKALNFGASMPRGAASNVRTFVGFDIAQPLGVQASTRTEYSVQNSRPCTVVENPRDE